MDGTPTPRAPGARARVRAELTREILETARAHLAAHGAASLSLRAVARDVGMVSSAVYRYFPSRDDLLTALIQDAYGSLADAVEAADRSARRRSTANRWLAVAHAVRDWALAHPHEYGLIYGTPIPGYDAPASTVEPAVRITDVLTELLRDGIDRGEVRDASADPLPRRVAAGLAPAVAYADLDERAIGRGLLAWIALFGAVSFELFGHLNAVVADPAAFFDHQMRILARDVLGAS